MIMENVIYKKTIRAAQGDERGDVLVLTEGPNATHLWVVLRNGEAIHMAADDNKTMAIDRAVSVCETLQKAGWEQFKKDGLGFLQYTLGIRAGLMDSRAKNMVDRATRNAYVAARNA